MFVHFYYPWLTNVNWSDNIFCWCLAIRQKLNLTFSLLMHYNKESIRVFILKWLNIWCCCHNMLNLWCLIHINQCCTYWCVFRVVRTQIGKIGGFQIYSIGRKTQKIAGRHRRGLIVRCWDVTTVLLLLLSYCMSYIICYRYYERGMFVSSEVETSDLSQAHKLWLGAHMLGLEVQMLGPGSYE